MINRIRIAAFEKGLLFEHGQFKRFLGTGVHWIPGFARDRKIIIVSQRLTYLAHDMLDQEDLEQIARSRSVEDVAVVLDVSDHQRALVWRDKRFYRVFGPGVHILWKEPHAVETEIIDASIGIFKHPQLPVILRKPQTAQFLDYHPVAEGHAGVFFRDGKYIETLPAGQYACWQGATMVSIYKRDIREQLMDIPGQEIMTADKVTLRLNAVVRYCIKDPLQAVLSSESVDQILYREAQLTSRSVIGTHELDALLYNKEKISTGMQQELNSRVSGFGLQVDGFGIRDIILPGDIKRILAKVTEARKIAEANLLTRREETAAMRNQANTARFYENNPALMRLKEFEVIEKIAACSNLSVVLVDKNLPEKVLHLL